MREVPFINSDAFSRRSRSSSFCCSLLRTRYVTQCLGDRLELTRSECLFHR